MCIEFVIQVSKQKNAHVSFPVGMVDPDEKWPILNLKHFNLGHFRAEWLNQSKEHASQGLGCWEMLQNAAKCGETQCGHQCFKSQIAKR